MTHTHATAVLPSWFRGVLIALVTLLMCSCRAPLDAPTELDALTDLSAPTDPAAAPPVFRGQSPDATAPEAEAPGVEQAACFARQRGGCNGGCQPSVNGRSCLVPGGEPLGPRDEYLCDGGDCGLKVGVREDGAVTGLEQEDTVAHYDTLDTIVDGRVCVTPSNRVCIYAPRFAAVRRVVNPIESNQRDFIVVFEEDASVAEADLPLPPIAAITEQPPVIRVGDNPPSLLRNRQQAGELEERVVVREVKDLLKPYANLQVVRLGILDNAEKPWLAKAIVSALTWTGDQSPQVAIEQKAASVLYSSVSPGVVYASPRGKPCLRLLKLASADHAKPGEEIEFTLRFDNVGTERVGNVTIVDNLATRLAYVPESAEASVDAKFSTSRNEGGSLVLRWEITKPIEPGRGGVLTFRVKVL